MLHAQHILPLFQELEARLVTAELAEAVWEYVAVHTLSRLLSEVLWRD